MALALRLDLKITLIFTIVSVLVLLLTTLTTTPDQLGPFGITVWFITFLIMLAGLLTFIFYSLKRSRDSQVPLEAKFVTSLRYGVLVSTWVTALVALNSLHQLGLKDIVLVSILVGLIEFYLRRTQ